MRRNRFARSLVFAAGVAAGWPAFALVAGPILGGASAFALYAIGITALYLLAIAPSPGRGRLAAAVAVALGLVVATLAHGNVELAVGCAALIGALRSGWLHAGRGGRGLRALVLEAGLLGGGLVLARTLAMPGLLGTALALWGFFLVQSGFFLVGGVTGRSRESGPLDPFELARTRLAALLDEE